MTENENEIAKLLSPHIDYQLDLSREKFFECIPIRCKIGHRCGLIVYTSPADDFSQLPSGWKQVLDRRSIIFVAAVNAGNEQPPMRRMGLAVLKALDMVRRYNIDPKRIYAAGLSGGARIASDLAFHQNDLFSGTIQSCGTNFYRPVLTDPMLRAENYGLNNATDAEVEQAKAKVKFALITGPGDFRYKFIKGIYAAGFQEEAFHAILLDRKMGHEDCDGLAFDEALDFLEEK
jgi:hypothetical protein